MYGGNELRRGLRNSSLLLSSKSMRLRRQEEASSRPRVLGAGKPSSCLISVLVARYAYASQCARDQIRRKVCLCAAQYARARRPAICSLRYLTPGQCTRGGNVAFPLRTWLQGMLMLPSMLGTRSGAKYAYALLSMLEPCGWEGGQKSRPSIGSCVQKLKSTKRDIVS